MCEYRLGENELKTVKDFATKAQYLVPTVTLRHGDMITNAMAVVFKLCNDPDMCGYEGELMATSSLLSYEILCLSNDNSNDRRRAILTLAIAISVNQVAIHFERDDEVNYKIDVGTFNTKVDVWITHFGPPPWTTQGMTKGV